MRCFTHGTFYRRRERHGRETPPRENLGVRIVCGRASYGSFKIDLTCRPLAAISEWATHGRVKMLHPLVLVMVRFHE